MNIALFLVYLIGVLFLLKVVAERGFFTERTGVEDVIVHDSDPRATEIAKNQFLIDWNPTLRFFHHYNPPGYRVLEFTQTQGENVLVVERAKAAFIIRTRQGQRYLFSEKGEKIWLLSDDKSAVEYSEIPEIFNVDDFDEAEKITGYLSGTSILFRNYLSSVDADTLRFFIKGGNILIINSWRNLEKFDENEFVWQLGNKKVYDLFSNGKFLPITRRGE